MKTKDFDRTQLTPTKVKGIISSTLRLIELHRKQHELFWELIAGICYEAPLPIGCTFKRAGLHAVAIATPTYWLVYQPGAKNMVEAMIKGELSPDLVPPRPIGVLIPSGTTKMKRTYTATEGAVENQVQLYYAVAHARKLGEYDATRGMIEIAHLYNVM